MKDIIKIATILPYKENYTFSKAQAAAIWVCDFFKYSDYKNTNFIFVYFIRFRTNAIFK